MGTVTGYAARMAATLIGARYALPGLRTGTWALLGCSGVLGVLPGVARKRPASRLARLVLALADLRALAGQLTRELRATTGVLIMTMGAGPLVTWALLIRPREVTPELAVQRKVLAIAFPAGDVLLLRVLPRRLTTVMSSSALGLASALGCSPSCCRAGGT